VVMTIAVHMIHYDNPPAHSTILYQYRIFLDGKNISVFPHRPYSCNLAPCIFFLVSQIELAATREGDYFDLGNNEE
jgi:hypothetical protein